MDLGSDVARSESRLSAFVERMAAVLGHADRVGPIKAYCTGLMFPGDRNSVEPIAAQGEPGRVSAAPNQCTISSRRPTGAMPRCNPVRFSARSLATSASRIMPSDPAR